MNARRARAGLQPFVPQAPTSTAGQEAADMLAALSLPLSPIPIAGDLAGLASDAAMYAAYPDERTLTNYGLTALGAFPFVPNAAAFRLGQRGLEIVRVPSGETAEEGAEYFLRNPSGKSAGYLITELNPANNTMVSLQTDIAPELRRQGVASDLYDAIQLMEKRDFVPSRELTPDGAAFWASRDADALKQMLDERYFAEQTSENVKAALAQADAQAKAQAAQKLVDAAKGAAEAPAAARQMPDEVAPLVMYRGLTREIDPTKTRGVNKLIFMSPDPQVASGYALNNKLFGLPSEDMQTTDWAERQLSNAREFDPEAAPNVFKLNIRPQNTFDFQNEAHIAQLEKDLPKILARATPSREPYTRREIKDTIEGIKKGRWQYIEDVAQNTDYFEKAGFDSLYVDEGGVKNLGVFDPTLIKSAITKKDGGPVYDPDRINQMVEQLMVPQMADGGPVRNLPQERREARRARATPPESLEGAFAQLEAAERAARLRGAGTPLGGAYRPDLYQYGGDSLLGAVLPIQRRIITPESQSAEFTGYDDRGRPMYEVITTPAELGPVERGPSLGTRLFGAAKELYNQATENPMGIVGSIENYLQGQMQAGGAGGRTWNPETQQLTEFDPAGIPGMAMGTGYALSTPIDGAVAGMAVKQKGGNWLAGDIEKKVAPLRRRTINNMDPAEKLAELERAYGPEGAAELVASGMYPSIREDAAINNWIDKALSKYIRNEMATPEDPVRLQAEAWAATQADLLAKKDAQIAKATADMERARAERGFTPEMMTRSQAQIRELQKERDLLAAQTGLHMPSREVSDFMLRMNENRRIGGGMPPTPMGVSPEARFWEALSDDAINPHHAGEYKREAKRGFTSIMAENPWLQQLPDTAVVNRFSGGSTRAHLGFGHLIDEMRNALNPESGLPRELLINPKDLPKLTVPQMVERVSKINAWRAVQKAEADAAIAANAATFPYRTYETIPGTTMPNERGLRWVELKTPEDGSSDALKDALKYEGEMLQHCVGGYCPDVEAGQSRIFSLRDARGQPYTTIEVKPGRSPSQSEAASQARAEGLRGQALAARVFDLMEGKHIPPEIKQIKGTQNRAPAEEYLPFVQDFVRSERWGDVWDTENAGLYYAHPDWLGMNMPENLVPKNLVGEAKLTDLLHRAQQAGLFGDRQYLTREEWEGILRQQIESESGRLPNQGYAEGGLVGLHAKYEDGGVVKMNVPKQITLADLLRRYAPEAVVDVMDELGQLRGAYNAGLETQIAPDEGGLPGLALQTASLPELPGALVTLAGAGVAAIDPETGLRIIDAGDKYAAMLPEDIASYSARYDAHLDRMLEKYGLPATGSLDPMDRFALAAGEMTGQLPMPAAWLNKLKAAKRIPKAIPLLAEYFGPVVDPKAANYAVGTTVGGALRQLEEPAPEKATLTYSPPAFPKMAEGGAFDADRINAMADQLMGKPQAFARGGIGRTADRAAEGAERAALTAAERAEAGRRAAQRIKMQEELKASEALGRARELGIQRVHATQSDRTRVGGGNIGGPAFSALSRVHPSYWDYVWGVGKPQTAQRLINLSQPGSAWTTLLGGADQLKSNPIVFDKLKRGFLSSMKAGALSDELADKINKNLALTFGEGVDIRDPSIWDLANTYDARAALADVMMGKGINPKKGGVALGGEKSGQGVIFRPSDILRRETEPGLLHTEHGGDVPTFAVGPRLFTLRNEIDVRPDLHPGYPVLIRGQDLDVKYAPVPIEIFMPDWHKKFADVVGSRKPGFYDYTMGLINEGLPSQEITDKYLKYLMSEGFADGGSVSYLQHLTRV